MPNLPLHIRLEGEIEHQGLCTAESLLLWIMGKSDAPTSIESEKLVTDLSQQ